MVDLPSPGARFAVDGTRSIDSEHSTARPLRVAIASPLGAGGRGGIDRLMDLVVEGLHGMPGGRPSITRFTTRGERGVASRPFVLINAVSRLTMQAMRGRIDVLHVNLAAGGSIFRKAILCRVARSFGIPYVVHVHSGRFQTFWDGAPSQVQSTIESCFRTSAAVIVLSREFHDYVLRRMPDLSSKLRLMANAVPALTPEAGKHAPGSRALVTFLGVLTEKKGVFDLIAALGRLKGRTDWSAQIAGYGDLLAAQQHVAAAGISGRVVFPGWLGAHDTARLLERSAVFVLPSYSEGLPMSVLEAFASGAAVIASNVGGIPDVVDDGRNGLLVAPGNVDQLTRALETLLDDPALRQRLADAGLADHAAHYDIDVYARRCVELWAEVARKAKATAP